MTTTIDRYQYLRSLLEVSEGRQTPDFDPLPHQITPPGDWFFWLLEAGRGAGKTATASKFIADHLDGPACISADVPHRVALIAPTLGDAVESATLTDMALIRHSPGAKFTQARGGSMVTWPNKSQVRLFGTNTMKDVDRLRAGGNRSLPVGTMIETSVGPRRIETVLPGDLVYTAAGLRPVTRTWDHGMRPVWQLMTESGRVSSLTPDHQVWTPDGFVRCDQLSVGGNIAVWNGTVTAGRNSVMDTGHAPSNRTDGPRPFYSTGRSGRSITDRSPTVTISTTSTGSRQTTPSRTSPPLILRDTTNTMPTSSTRGGTRQVDGLQAGIRSPSRTASNVATRSKVTAKPGSVPKPAGVPSRLLVPQRQECGHASCAAHYSTVPPGPPPSLVPDRVATISRGNVARPVWDLTVAGEHAFVADGVYVANCAVWAEELAAWPHIEEGWADMMFGLRLGPNPRIVATTTPRRRPQYLKIKESADVVSHATTMDNPNLNETQRARLYEMYGDTTLGQQELYGLVVDDVDGALWDTELIDHRPDLIFDTSRMVVGVDPPGGVTECGIVTAGRVPECPCGGDRMPHFVVVDDRSGKLSPNGWATRVVSAYHDFKADRVLGEANYGGDMVESTIRSVDRSVSYSKVTASRGKRVRAEPVKALYEQGRVHHTQVFDALETEMVSWVPDDSSWSPNRLDALVWALTDLAGISEWKFG